MDKRSIALIVLLAATLVAEKVAAVRYPEPLERPLESIASQIQDWKEVKTREMPSYSLRALKPSSYLLRTYNNGAYDLDLFIAHYEQQRSGESMHSPKHCLPGSGWEIWKLDSAAVPFQGAKVRVNKYSIANQGRRMLMFYWYQSKDRIVADELMAKVLLAKDALLTGHTGGSIVRLTMPDSPQGEAQGVAAAASIMDEVSKCMGRGGKSAVAARR